LTDFFELVSGSDAFKAEFESLEAKVIACQEAGGVLISKKKSLEKRKRILAEAKEEAERYRELTSTLVRPDAFVTESNFSKVAKLGGWSCFLCKILVLGEVGHCYMCVGCVASQPHHIGYLDIYTIAALHVATALSG
jgi:predicted aminopeptidase